jgi:spore germination protein GerM
MAHPWVMRTVPAGADPLAVAVTSLIRGPTTEEAAHGLWVPFDRSTSDPATKPLRVHQVRVTVKDGVATVDFDKAAESYLHQAACASSAVTSAFEFTLRQFEQVKEVQFAVDGAVITEWDA